MLSSWHTLQAFFIKQRTQVYICMWLQHKAITSERHIKFRKTKTIQHNKQMQMTTTKLLTHEWARELAKQELKRPVVKPSQSHQRDGHTYIHTNTCVRGSRHTPTSLFGKPPTTPLSADKGDYVSAQRLARLLPVDFTPGLHVRRRAVSQVKRCDRISRVRLRTNARPHRHPQQSDQQIT